MTTICAVKKGNQSAIAGDGQITMGERIIMKGSARKNQTYFRWRSRRWFCWWGCRCDYFRRNV